MKTRTTMIFRTALVALLMALCNFEITAQTVKDFDGNTYKISRLGRQEWMGENLNVAHFMNGDAIPEAKTEEEWVKANTEGKPVWCYYKSDPENGKKHGKLYNWYAINDKRGLAPEGWMIPTNNEWRLLIKNLLGVDVAAAKLKSKTAWKAYGSGEDKIGFSALPGGVRQPDGKFEKLGTKGQWWSNSGEIRPSEYIYSIAIDDASPEIKYVKMAKSSGLSVRCVRAIK